MVGGGVAVGRVIYIDKLLGIIFRSGFVITKLRWVLYFSKTLFIIAEGDNGYQYCNSEYETSRIDGRTTCSNNSTTCN